MGEKRTAIYLLFIIVIITYNWTLDDEVFYNKVEKKLLVDLF